MKKGHKKKVYDVQLMVKGWEWDCPKCKAVVDHYEDPEDYVTCDKCGTECRVDMVENFN